MGVMGVPTVAPNDCPPSSLIYLPSLLTFQSGDHQYAQEQQRHQAKTTMKRTSHVRFRVIAKRCGSVVVRPAPKGSRHKGVCRGSV